MLYHKDENYKDGDNGDDDLMVDLLPPRYLSSLFDKHRPSAVSPPQLNRNTLKKYFEKKYFDKYTSKIYFNNIL